MTVTIMAVVLVTKYPIAGAIVVDSGEYSTHNTHNATSTAEPIATAKESAIKKPLRKGAETVTHLLQ
jgi:hypothetical protein